jgi:hypothetical protein
MHDIAGLNPDGVIPNAMFKLAFISKVSHKYGFYKDSGSIFFAVFSPVIYGSFRGVTSSNGFKEQKVFRFCSARTLEFI